MANSKLKCRQCKQYFRRETMVKTPKGNFCTYEHATQYAIPRAKKLMEREKKRQHREDKRDLKPISHWLKETQNKTFNPWVLKRDFDQPCISCGDWDAIEYHCGHFRSIGAASHLRFTPDNCAKQCAKCNTHLSGNQERYRINLVNKIGAERVEALENNNKPKSWTREELEAIRKTYRTKIKELTTGNC